MDPKCKLKLLVIRLLMIAYNSPLKFNKNPSWGKMFYNICLKINGSLSFPKSS